VRVKVVEIDNMGRINLSRVDAMSAEEREQERADAAARGIVSVASDGPRNGAGRPRGPERGGPRRNDRRRGPRR